MATTPQLYAFLQLPLYQYVNRVQPTLSGPRAAVSAFGFDRKQVTPYPTAGGFAGELETRHTY